MGAILFNRFFMRQSFARFDRWLVATACFLTACKVEEMHRKLREVLALSLKSRWRNDKRVASTLESPTEYPSWRDKLTDMERQVLYTLEMDVAVDTPYHHISAQVVRWRDSGALGRRDEASLPASQLDRVACVMAHSLSTSEAGLLFSSHEIAMASLLMAVRWMAAFGSPVRVTEAAFFEGRDPSQWLIRDRATAAAIFQCYQSDVAAGFALDEAIKTAVRERVQAKTAALSASSAAASRESAPSPTTSAAAMASSSSSLGLSASILSPGLMLPPVAAAAAAAAASPSHNVPAPMTSSGSVGAGLDSGVDVTSSSSTAAGGTGSGGSSALQPSPSPSRANPVSLGGAPNAAADGSSSSMAMDNVNSMGGGEASLLTAAGLNSSNSSSANGTMLQGSSPGARLSHLGGVQSAAGNNEGYFSFAAASSSSSLSAAGSQSRRQSSFGLFSSSGSSSTYSSAAEPSASNEPLIDIQALLSGGLPSASAGDSAKAMAVDDEQQSLAPDAVR